MSNWARIATRAETLDAERSAVGVELSLNQWANVIAALTVAKSTTLADEVLKQVHQAIQEGA